MHPSLDPYVLKDCADVIEAYQKCQQERTIAKFFGGCNKAKLELDKCLQKDVSLILPLYALVYTCVII